MCEAVMQQTRVNRNKNSEDDNDAQKNKEEQHS